jgi:A/G-specific adenine glycosylase
MTPLLIPDRRRRLRRQLLAWFARHRRAFPWRCDRDPYRIWVSEVMLQQTQAATVIPYFERFLAAFPTVFDLAAADEQDVLRAWQGLGYYRRARDLRRAARQVVRAHGGCFPCVPAAAAALPGLGRYMVGAILSQAFECRLPILEANSQRLLCRLFAIRDDPTGGPARRRLWQLAECLLPGRRVGDFNQALMELGALVCTPSAPRCEECPLIKECAARRLGIQGKVPARPKRPGSLDVREAGVVIRHRQRVLLVQRPPGGRWAGLWEFPHGPLESGETVDAAAVRLARQLVGLRVRLGSELLTLRHAVTHHRITVTCFEATRAAGVFRSAMYPRGQWIEPARIADFPVSAPQRRLAKALIASERQGLLFDRPRPLRG